MSNKEHLESMRHSCEHVLTMAMMRLWPGQIKAAMGPSTEDGFYFDFDSQVKISEEDFENIEQEMRKIIAENLPIIKDEMTVEQAKTFFENNTYKGNEYKHEWINIIEKRGEQVSVYWMGEKEQDMPQTFVDICSGPHVESTGKIGAFKLLKIAGAYWHGDEKNKMLTRIYGTAFETQQELDKYLFALEEAKKRDHRKLGKELDLFHIDEKVGLGLPLWHPRGAILWRKIEDFWYAKHLENGYELVRSPHIGNQMLWETSGHFGFYNDSMYPPLEVGQTLKDLQENRKAEISETYLLKPMNCPFHIQIYKNQPHSYREFPMRWAECGTVYRFEKRGELSGLTRVRGFTQDDAHIICRTDQVKDELKRVVDFILFIYQSFGFDINSVEVFLSLRDSLNPSKYAGTDEGWTFTQNVLREVAKEKQLHFSEEEGEAAFYGPKLDFKIRDCLGRLWQCSTLQFDFNLPERFDMTFVNSSGQDERPFVLHRALFGSFERFIGLLIEHYAGAFPIWVAPVQVRLATVGSDFVSFAREFAQKLIRAGIRVEVDESDEKVGKKIRDAAFMKIPWTIVIGEKEVAGQDFKVNVFGKEESLIIAQHEFVQQILEASQNPDA
ncbi:threonine--tRNA ligase [Candidatus Uhrbacteria bacterium CG_4_9_14_3_um_filter_36_7]|uniref:Threonine--tRNA ligase n=1 Tax=Candidatus Uhrbacteria bacterium CG_4_9_14_3_um_filter_36_7 TaxID=1975033 RepID=A0A2M7XIB7_9BACT|nr:MAG: threonine--tRNA ligase [Candidatus Uhrbacteria bacterium CG_4_9_14_3_um_filter_36_7]